MICASQRRLLSNNLLYIIICPSDLIRRAFFCNFVRQTMLYMDIVIIILLILLNGLFAMSEVALISARKSNLRMQAAQGSRSARRALALAEDSR